MLKINEIKRLENEAVMVEGSKSFISIIVWGNPYFEIWDNKYSFLDIPEITEKEKIECDRIISRLEKLNLKRID